jgi:alpha-D-ribose 1-methylphosphonate 5-triphosphate synthase subunit PhnG
MTNLAREQWVSALSLVPKHELKELVMGFPTTWQLKPITLPQAGLGMMKVREGALAEDFYLGELPVASCHIEITTEMGTKAQGAAWLMDDDQDRAEQMAICDAILSAKLTGWEKVAALIERGEQLKQQRDRERKSLLAKTRVDFSLLEDVGDDNA